MSGLPRPLLPMPTGDDRKRLTYITQNDTTLKTKRSLILAACEVCRKKKARCDGERPHCRSCIERGTQCTYQANKGESTHLAIKRKIHDTESENEQFKELFTLIRTRPVNEAQEIFNRIRYSEDPIEVLHAINDANILLPQPMSNSFDDVDPRLLKLNQEALETVPIKVPARPWTIVAGDGIVSELITEFFANDHLYFFPPIDRMAFLGDMQKADIENARYCSPLLVNAICAHRCFWSRRARAIGFITRQDLAERFIQESKKLLDNECGRARLTTLLALYIMYATMALQGKDRAGNMFRYMTIDMLKRLNFTRRFSQLHDDVANEVQEKRIISNALWGLFIFESRVCSMYRHPSFIIPPSLPRLFENYEQDQSMQHNIDIMGHPWTEESTYPAQTPGILHAVSDLSMMFYKIIKYNCQSSNIKDEQDVTCRANFYSEWKVWRDQLPYLFRFDKNLTLQTCWLSSHSNEVALSILHPLGPNIMLTGQKLSVKQLSIQHCQDEIKLANVFFKQWPPDSLIGRGQFIALSTLVPLLEDRCIHQLFTAGCQNLRFTTTIIPIMKVFLQGIEALAWSLNQIIPLSARIYFEDLEQKDDIMDLPTNFVLPQLQKLQDLLIEDDHDDGLSETGNEISKVIARWSSMTVNN